MASDRPEPRISVRYNPDLGRVHPSLGKLRLDFGTKGELLMKTVEASEKTWNRLILEMLVTIERNRMLKQLRRLGAVI